LASNGDFSLFGLMHSFACCACGVLPALPASGGRREDVAICNSQSCWKSLVSDGKGQEQECRGEDRKSGALEKSLTQPAALCRLEAKGRLRPEPSNFPEGFVRQRALARKPLWRSTVSGLAQVWFRPRKGAKTPVQLAQVWFSLVQFGSGLVQVWFRSGSGLVQVWFRSGSVCWMGCLSLDNCVHISPRNRLWGACLS